MILACNEKTLEGKPFFPTQFQARQYVEQYRDREQRLVDAVLARMRAD